jgi:Fe-S-cluster containining protein
MRTARVELSLGDHRLQAELTVPAGPTRLMPLLPMLQELTDGVVRGAVEAAAKRNERVSCAKGCGACCRQLVPVSKIEARRIAALIDELPEPRQSMIRARFTEARRRLEGSGLSERLLSGVELTKEQTTALGLEYFSQGIPCPFLEEESCSIYHDRPLACREYLVSSPAENCAIPSPQSIRRLPIVQVSMSVARLDDSPAPGLIGRWVPLILAPEWSSTHREAESVKPGPVWVEKLLEILTGKQIPQSLPQAGGMSMSD